MKPIDLEQLDKDMEAIVAAVSAPGSIPLAIMEATRPNHAIEWSEAEDARRFDENLEAQFKGFEQAVEVLITKPRT
jgi:hypothetical protein